MEPRPFGTAWMATYCQNLLELAVVLAEYDRVYEDLTVKFFEHFALIASALNNKGLWDEDDGLYYDVLHLADGSSFPLRAHSLVSLIPLFAVTTFGPNTMERLPEFTRRTEWFHPQPRRSPGRGPAYPRPEPFRLADAVDRQP